MNEDRITPAVNIEEEMLTEMSADEFQRRLYTWFEDRGLLSELRAHLRMQMIGVLRDTAIGRTVTSQQKQAISPKMQALNLLIAEFFLKQDYHYTLSVFSTEVPLINVIPEFPGMNANVTFNKNDSLKKWQFSEKDMWDILETLGIRRDSDNGQNIYGAYYKTINREALLTCVIRMLHLMQYKSQASCSIKHNKNFNQDQEDWVCNVNEILIAQGLNTQSSQNILQIISETVKSERERITEEARENYLKLKATLEEQTSRREENYKKKIVDIQKAFEFEKTKLESVNSRRQTESDNLGAKLQKHQRILKDRHQHLVERERAVEEREARLSQKEEYLLNRQQKLQSRHDSLCREQQSVMELKDKIQQEKIKAAQSDAEFLMNLQEECKDVHNQISNTQEALLNLSASKVVENHGKADEVGAQQNVDRILLKGLVKQLQAENSGLKSLNAEQQLRIQELSERAAVLMRQLERTQIAVNSLNEVQTVSAPPLVAPATSLNGYQNVTNSYGAGGEEGNQATAPVPRQYRNLSRDSKKRTAPRRLTVHSSSSSDDYSPTNEILQEARQRLRRLEQESEEVDKNYRQFRSAYAEMQHRPPESQNADFSFGNSLFAAFNVVGPESNPGQLQNEARSSRTADDCEKQSTSRIDSNYNSNQHPERSLMALPHCDHTENSARDSNPNHLKLSKYLKQENNFNLTQFKSKDVNTKNALRRFDRNEVLEKPDDAATDTDDRNAEEVRSSVNQSAASSGILDLLEAATSGVSISNPESSQDDSN